MGQEQLSKEINTIFDSHRIPYEGISERKVKGDLLKLIAKSHIELLKSLKKNIEYNENGQNKVINSGIKALQAELSKLKEEE